MDPRRQFCHNPDCAARGEVGGGNIRVHSRKERRCKCSTCGKTFAGTKGTAMYRSHKPPELFFLVLVLLSHGCPVQAIVAAFGLDDRTVADWLLKAGIHCEAVQEHPVKGVELGCVQADELWVKLVGRRVWMAMAICVPHRLWLGGAVGAIARTVRAATKSPGVLVMTDGLSAYAKAFRRAWRQPLRTGERGRPRLVEEEGLLMGQAVKQYQKRRVVGIIRRVAVGTLDAVERDSG